MANDPRLAASLGPALLARCDEDYASDAQLLTRYLDDRDPDAFATLVTRHGPMVHGVCARVARDAHLADDAFQAVFLLLSQRASRVRPRAAVRGWLYGVAVRTARTAGTRARRRQRREASVPTVPDRPTAAAREAEPDALLALHEEVARLPERLRAAVVLCELSGVSRKRAALHLGVSEGTLSSRLAAARKRLAEMMRRRGFVGRCAALGLLLDQVRGVAGPVPRHLRLATERLVSGGVDLRAGAVALAGHASRGPWITAVVAAVLAAPLLAVCAVEGGSSPPPPAATLPARSEHVGKPSADSARATATQPAAVARPRGEGSRAGAVPELGDGPEPRILDFAAVELCPGRIQASGRVEGLPARRGVIEFGGVPSFMNVQSTVASDGRFSCLVNVGTDGTDRGSVTARVVTHSGRESNVAEVYVDPTPLSEDPDPGAAEAPERRGDDVGRASPG